MLGKVLVRGESWLTRERVRGWCAVVLAIYLLLIGVSFVTAARNQGQTVFGTVLGADFPAFYVAGRIINEYGATQLYQRELQGRLYHEMFPREEQDALLPYLNAPFFVLPFPLLARLPYAWAYLVWFFLSLALYVTGFTLLWRVLPALPQAAYRTGLLAALSFMPLLVECLAGGQTSAFGFFCLTLAIVLERRGRLWWSGLALALLIYKPTLLILLAPMLLLTQRWRTLAGLALGSVLLMLFSALALGWEVTTNWFNTMLGYSQHSTAATSGLRIWKYVDVNSYARGLFGAGALRWLLVGAVVAAVLPLLVKAWRKGAPDGLDWALAIAWTPVLNLYLGFYDTTLVLASVLLLAGRQSARGGLSAAEKFLLLLLYVVPWFSQPIARQTGMQLFTLALAAWGGYLLRQVWREEWRATLRPAQIAWEERG